MIPILLKLKGIYSYQDEQTVDFQTLTSAQLFGVFGKVGTGKSTLLEAITLALYGNVERLNSINRNYNLMNLKSNELFVDFEFEHHDEKRYRFTVHGKRNSKRFSEVNTLTRKAYVKEGEEWIPLQHTDADPIIGLSYANFKRTIIIPQGKFQEFLQLSDTERTVMLQEIFQLNKFDLSDKVRIVDQQNAAALHTLEGQLMQFEEITEEKIELLKTTIQTIEEQYTTLTNELNQLKIEEQKGIELENLVREFNKLSIKLKEKEADLPKINQKELQLSRYEDALIHFKHPIEQLTEVEQKKRSYDLKIVELKEKVSQLETALNKHKEEKERLTPHIEKLADNINEHADLVQLIHLKKLENDQKKLNHGIKSLEEKYAKSALELNQKKQNRRELAEQLLQDKQYLLQYAVLDSLSDWWNKTNNLTEQFRNEQELSTKINAEKGQKLNELSDLLSTIYTKESSNKKLIPTEIVGLIEEEIEQLKEQQQHLELERNGLNIKHELSHFAAHLELGKACPLCGALEHPNPRNSANYSGEIEALNNTIDALKKTLLNTEKINLKVRVILGQLEQMDAQIKQHNSKIESIKTSLSEHKIAYKWNDFVAEDFELFQQKKAEKEAINARIQQKEKDIEAYGKTIDEVENEVATCKQLLDEEQLKLRDKCTQFEVLKGQLTDETRLELLSEDSTTLESRAEETNRYIEQLKIGFEEVNQKIQADNTALIEVNATYNSALTQVLQLEMEVQKVTKTLHELLQNSTFADLAEIRELLNKPLALEALKDEISTFKNELFSLKQQLEINVDKLAGRTFNELEFQALKNQVVTLQEKVKLLEKERVEQQTILAQLEEKCKEKHQLLVEQQALEAKKMQLNTLRKLFSGKGFVNYVSRVYLQQLCASANERFYRLTRQQLRLELNDKNNFEIRDYLNNGQLRNVRTLSGGQTFQASLCLALALAENLPQQQGAKQNFFFLDEGFGSLDSETLQLVFEALKALRNEQRVVGVISHVEELQQEIGVYLRIDKTENGASKITSSWE